MIVGGQSYSSVVRHMDSLQFLHTYGFAQPSAVHRHVQGFVFHGRFITSGWISTWCMRTSYTLSYLARGWQTSPLGAGLVFQTRATAHTFLRTMGLSMATRFSLCFARMATPLGAGLGSLRIFLTYRPYILRIESDFSPGRDSALLRSLGSAKHSLLGAGLGFPSRIFLTYRP